MKTQQTDALQCAADLEYSIARHGMQDAFTLNAYRAMKMVRTQHARIADLEAQLEAIGAGGVSGPLIGQPQAMPDLSQLTERGAKAWAGVDAQGLREGFTAADMATAAAQGFRDGVASVAASAESEPVATIKSWTNGSYWRNYNVVFHRDDLPVGTDLYTHPSPPEGMAGRLQVYRCKIKSKKQIDKEIPREQQGWWADVAAGQKLLLRQAVQSDLDRCTLGGKRSMNPADYMCETQTNGSLVSKVALEYMNPEQNVFAAAHGPADQF